MITIYYYALNSDMVNILGAKNLFEANMPAIEKNGLTAAPQGDGSYIFSGTASADSDFHFHFYSAQYIPAGTYIMNGISGGSESTYKLYLGLRDDSREDTRYVGITDGDSNDIVIGNNVELNIFLRVFNNATMSNVVIKPMLRPASIEDSTFVPYAKSNKELTEVLSEFNQTDNVVLLDATSGTGTKTLADSYTKYKYIELVAFGDDHRIYPAIIPANLLISAQYKLSVAIQYGNSVSFAAVTFIGITSITINSNPNELRVYGINEKI